ncbi:MULTISPECIES: acyl CoA:acetate/3-ketoacid CoA transferase [unclassified Sedimentibacter]|uniref:acyl CoA:acetate/3-ketoacid CoA transferase n=1 Tax=unclassified Sedimentibacter TaxID=2649220 RepID=UPI0027DF2C1E|nr:CoA-transferase [Sedimentibacter sp. MB35-C1]WMJ78720.1 CoA-transferase [Sedimentibacter sp. MB35-C1]
MAQVITAKEAAELFKDNATVCTAGFGLAGWPEEVALAVRKRFDETGHPKNITHTHAAGLGNWGKGPKGERGECLWVADGLMTKLIVSHAGSSPSVIKQIVDNKIMAWNFPLGTLIQLYHEAGRGAPGLLTKTGLGTFIDPRYDGGKLNDLTKEKGEELVEYIPDFMGEEYLFFKAFPIDIGFMRGTTADENGNITCEKEALNLEMLSVAQAAKASGGIVIAQVESLAKAGSLNPKLVKVPSIYVDYIVVAEHPEDIMQTQGTFYNRAFTGEIRVPIEGSMEAMPLNEKKVMLRRLTMEIKPGYKCNFGIGTPTYTGNVMSEEGCADEITMISESGSIGGVPGGGNDFGAHWNIEASCDQGDHFSFFDGGGLDFGVFGLSEVDKDGNVNTSLLNGKIMGVGGFANIAATAKNAIFVGTFTAGGIKCRVEDGKMIIDQEGKFKKFVKSCPQLTFNAEQSLKKGNRILFITERCVIERTDKGMILTEIAPGIDLKTQVLDQMEFAPIIPEGGPKLMPKDIFNERWGKLKEIMENNK